MVLCVPGYQDTWSYLLSLFLSCICNTEVEGAAVRISSVLFQPTYQTFVPPGILVCKWGPTLFQITPFFSIESHFCRRIDKWMFSIVNHNLVHFQGRVLAGRMGQKTIFPLKRTLKVVLTLKKRLWKLLLTYLLPWQMFYRISSDAQVKSVHKIKQGTQEQCSTQALGNWRRTKTKQGSCREDLGRHWGDEVDLSLHVKASWGVVYICNLSTREAETGGFLEDTGQPVSLADSSQSQWQCLKKQDEWHLKIIFKIGVWPPHTAPYRYTCTSVNTTHAHRHTRWDFI
jgi:hypothetical protein